MPATQTPSQDDLRTVMSQVLESFAYALPTPRSDDQGMDLDVRADLPEGRGWLVLRGSQSLARRLAEDSTGDEDPSLAMDAFRELCNLVVSHLVSRLWGDSHSLFQPFVPVAGLPQGECRSRALMDVDGEPLEASYWTAA